MASTDLKRESATKLVAKVDAGNPQSSDVRKSLLFQPEGRIRLMERLLSSKEMLKVYRALHKASNQAAPFSRSAIPDYAVGMFNAMESVLVRWGKEPQRTQKRAKRSIAVLARAADDLSKKVSNEPVVKDLRVWDIVSDREKEFLFQLLPKSTSLSKILCN